MVYMIRGHTQKDYKKKKQSTRKIAESALRKINTVVRNDELKWLDTTITDATVAQVGAVIGLSTITQGTSENNMVGDQCRLTSIQYNVSFVETASNTSSYQVRFLLVKFKDSSAGTTVTQVLDDATAGDNITSLYEMTGRDNYKILEDSVITVAPGYTGTHIRTHRVKRQLNVKHYQSEGQDESTIVLFVLHNHTDEQLNLNGKARLFFKEL
jgi:ribosomal protein S7